MSDHKAALMEARHKSTLPQWCLQAISYEAYQQGHSAGKEEIDMIEIELIYDFQESFNKSKELGIND